LSSVVLTAGVKQPSTDICLETAPLVPKVILAVPSARVNFITMPTNGEGKSISYQPESPARTSSRSKQRSAIRFCSSVNLGHSPLFAAAQENALSAAKWLIERGGASVDQAKNNGASPLFVSSQEGHYEVATMLLAHSAKVDLEAMNDGITPLMIRCKNGHQEVAELPLNNGAKVDQADNSGWSFLLASSQQGHHEVVKLLMAKGTKVDQVDNAGGTALSKSRQKKKRRKEKEIMFISTDSLH